LWLFIVDFWALFKVFCECAGLKKFLEIVIVFFVVVCMRLSSLSLLLVLLLLLVRLLVMCHIFRLFLQSSLVRCSLLAGLVLSSVGFPIFF